MALKREYPALQNLKFLPFFLFLCVIFALLDPDPDPADQNQCGSESETLDTLHHIVLLLNEFHSGIFNVCTLPYLSILKLAF